MDEHNEPTLREWLHCPFCKSDQIEGGSFDVEGTQAWQRVDCLNCEGTWNEVYQAAFRDEMRVGTTNPEGA